MKRLTTDNPRGNYSSALNLFYIKDNETWVRGGGAAPDYRDVTLREFMRKIIKNFGFDIPASGDEELDEIMAELLFDGTDTLEGVLATLYAAAWAFSLLRSRLAYFEDAEEAGQLSASWISTNERLPEIGQKVLIFWTANGEPCIDTAFYSEGWKATHWALSCVVTHWMPLPTAPEKGHPNE